ncbi:MAG: cell division protein FtsK [Gammaproteobacteria bacterium]|nr:cell division protein FtsK [Gammaproteobacteria bacterium]MCP4275956.1 cell division protein FtsK [Gammaproteobacteria bacterium]MCP4832172.1 cell division protein FtsK [Gammaproteobacteria bacterium]MCP4928227.1 cell division protein FtsK [Gammaproteobacteria bacterium]
MQLNGLTGRGKNVAKAAQLGRQGSTASSAVTRSVRESALWVFGAIALILLLALLTYHPDDPGFSHTGTSATTLHNQIGLAGAWFADIAFYLSGMPAYLFPVITMAAGWMLFSARKTDEPLNRTVISLRTCGFLLALVTSCGLATLHFSTPELRETTGGVLGQMVGQGLKSGLGELGATLLMLSVWLAAISLFTGLSWLGAMDWIGKQIFRFIDWLTMHINQLQERMQTRKLKMQRQASVQVKREKVEKRVRKAKPRIEPAFKAPEKSTRAEKERQVPMFDPPVAGTLPPLSLLDDPPERPPGYSEEALEGMSRLVELKLQDFGVDVEVVAVHPGPVVTRFELNPAAGVKVSQISNLAKDIARSLSAISVRVVENIPGKSYVGLEIPNEAREMVTLGEILRSRAYEELPSPLTLALGKDISGKSVVADLGKMPHLMIAGTTGSGKSVGINAMVLSLLYKSKPEHVRMIMIDPKMLELSVYEGIPHLLCPVVTDMKDAANSLRWCVAEMERRYKLMAALKVRNLGGYNRKVSAAISQGQPMPDPLFHGSSEDIDGAEIPTLQELPNIVVVIDELADMMMIVGKKVEELIARLAQKARASGIHLIVATQRPSVDVITGLIKANIPCRIAFQVSAKVDSRTILDQSGAENLLGHGDMLFLPTGAPMPIRVHGAFVSDEEVQRVATQLKASGTPSYLEEVTTGPAAPIPGLSGEPKSESSDEDDPLYDQAVQIVTETRRASISGVQRRLKIGYNRAARLVEAMEAAGIVGPMETNGVREVLVPPPPKD